MKASHYLANVVSEQQGSRRWQLGRWKNTNLETKFLPRKSCFLDKYSQKTRLKEFSRSPKVTWPLRRCWSYFETHARGNFPGGGSRSKIIAKGKNNWKKLLYTWSTLATPPIYYRAFREKLAIASPGNPMDVTNPSLLLLFVQQDEKCLEELTSIKETYVVTTFGKMSMRKVRSESRLASTTTVVHVAYFASGIKWYASIWSA